MWANMHLPVDELTAGHIMNYRLAHLHLDDLMLI